MSGKSRIRRILVCVDGTFYNPDGKEGKGAGNNTNVFRIFASVRFGKFIDENGNEVEQIPKYFPGIGLEKPTLTKYKDGYSGSPCKDLIEEVFYYCCTQIKSSEDEVWLYGFSRGAYVVRAVASLLHNNTLKEEAALAADKSLWKRITRLGPRKRNPAGEGMNGQKFLLGQENGREPPVIKLLGLFDTVKQYKDDDEFDISHVSSIKDVRHALAMNEERPPFQPVLYEARDETSLEKKEGSYLQAWFVGAHGDMGGGGVDDGLSLYPLQWMLNESRDLGLVLEYNPRPQLKDLIQDPLKLAFPSPPPLSLVGDSKQLDEPQPWTYRYSNGVEATMYDLRRSHRHGNLQAILHNKLKKQGPRRATHNVLLNRSMLGTLTTLGKRKVFDTASQSLEGYEKTSGDVTIIHPSVYFLLDTYPMLGIKEALQCFGEQLKSFKRDFMTFVSSEQDIPSDPWVRDILPEHSTCRILICGNTGVGKSTLLNKVFGLPMTQENSDQRGEHNIEDGFESDQHPGIIIHDSEGFQAGNKKELAVFKKFLRKRAESKDLRDQLHAIWLCIDTDTDRPVQSALANVLQEVSKSAPGTPLVIVGTKKDKFLKLRRLDDYPEKTADDSGKKGQEQVEQDLLSAREALFRSKFETEAETCEIWPQLNAKFAFVSRYDQQSIKELIHKTTGSFGDPVTSEALIAAQIPDIDAKIDQAVEKTLRLLRTAVNTASLGAGLGLTSYVATPSISRHLCHEIAHGCFGMPAAKVDEVNSVLSRLVWANLSSFMAQTLGQFSVIWGGIAFLTATTVVGSIPLIVGAPLFEAPAAARMVIKCACDMILILADAFRAGGKSASRGAIEAATAEYTKNRIPAAEGGEDGSGPVGGARVLRSRRRLVHQEVNRLIPLVSSVAMEALRKRSASVAMGAYRQKSVSEYRDGMTSILAKYGSASHEAAALDGLELDGADVASIGSATLYSESAYFDIPEDKEEMKQFLGEKAEERGGKEVNERVKIGPQRVDIHV
ncbi:Putative GTP binding domain, Tle1 phospholipase, P-loop containing nucleoside triphosphate hydrolase [Colletotrichum destructivum]|uniref:GTP binding domain, Tle1 phospholipase, P-loop containing nucleoside triphosphate hydrolase n=1 Tax=Colletotrichum destructivum TaxID=34406 RepID=A0AAX4I922_9PEZI|nr:Putative GTP binding domain, Tle1 phospholipase, P-loop containing nucleoside triphosphate hydrolase [Colletotrichum destructivum]